MYISGAVAGGGISSKDSGSGISTCFPANLCYFFSGTHGLSPPRVECPSI